MDRWGFVPGLLCLAASAAFVLWNRRKTRNTMKRIKQMLDAAIDGTFTETTFNESELSALETRFSSYLSASATSAENVAAEKDKIKTLIADISHQTKTPISNLLLYSELLLEDDLPDSAKASAEAIHTQSEKLRFLIDSLVKLSRLENGILTLLPKPSPVRPMLERIAAQYAAKAAQKGVSLRLESEDITAVFDAKWTGEALENIIDNAVKYTRQGGVTISSVSYEMFVRIDVSDTGIGIPESEQAVIFSRFYRSEMVREQEGVGVGLYLARQIVSEEGGYIKVISAPGQGSTFSVFLPR